MLRKIFKWLAMIVAVLLVGFAGLVAWNWDMVQRIFLGGVHVYETVPPEIPSLPADAPAVLIFSKTNGFRHEEAIPAANALFTELAQDEGLGVFATENGAAFTPEILSRFDVVVFNNVSGDVFTPNQRAAFRAFIARGGGVVAVHGAGGDMSYDWAWYRDQLIGAQFIGHPMNPQFQEARINIENADHPATEHLGATIDWTDEFYSFDRSVRGPGVNILLTLDEATYSPVGMFGSDLRMGRDHPIAWTRCIGRGRVFYSALGHQARAYTQEPYALMLYGALRWAIREDGSGCSPNRASAQETQR
jgi:uncharacterized protein